jgi:cytochrome bd-type quinol oxidase subunit 2
MDNLIGDDRFPVASCRPEQSTLQAADEADSTAPPKTGKAMRQCLMVALTFESVFGTLAISFWLHMIAIITIDEAAEPRSSLAFMFWGERLFIFFIFPLMLLHTVIGYRVFRAKVGTSAAHH